MSYTKNKFVLKRNKKDRSLNDKIVRASYHSQNKRKLANLLREDMHRLIIKQNKARDETIKSL